MRKEFFKTGKNIKDVKTDKIKRMIIKDGKQETVEEEKITNIKNNFRKFKKENIKNV